MSEILILLVPLGVLALYSIVTYNRLVSLRLRISESWANVDTELKRRHDLVPNLVATVQGHAAHERGLMEDVTRLRAEALADREDSEHRFETEAGLAHALGQLVAIVESHPELKASGNFLHLQRQLVETEDRIQASRRFYNGNVRDYNNKVQQFPSNLVARRMRFERHAYFELPSVAQREVPRVT